jgi:hypothetical protein
LDETLIGTEGGRNLHGIQDSQAPRGSGSHIDETASGPKGIDGQVDGPGNGIPLFSHRRRDCPILGVDEFDDLKRGERADPGRSGVLLFR